MKQLTVIGCFMFISFYVTGWFLDG